MYKHPFKIDPFAGVYTAFRNLYPECDCVISWDNEIKDEKGETCCGVTRFALGKIPIVKISPELTVFDAVEVLAHELAHVVNGPDNMQHGPDWEKVLDALLKEYERATKATHPNAVKLERKTDERCS